MKNFIVNIFREQIRKLIYTEGQYRGANLIMNGDWFDCNKCGVIINKLRAVCYGKEYEGILLDEEICNKFGAVCHHCYDGLLEAKFHSIK